MMGCRVTDRAKEMQEEGIPSDEIGRYTEGQCRGDCDRICGNCGQMVKCPSWYPDENEITDKFSGYYSSGIIQFNDEGMKCFKDSVRSEINEFIISKLADKNNLKERQT